MFVTLQNILESEESIKNLSAFVILANLIQIHIEKSPDKETSPLGKTSCLDAPSKFKAVSESY